MEESQYKSLLSQAGLKQKELAALLGIDATTVNRWDWEAIQSRPAPRYAIQFLRAYVMLSSAQKAELKRG